MLGIALLFIGAVLVVNGIFLLGKVEAKSAGILNLLTGGLTMVINFILMASAKAPTDYFLPAAIMLFTFTYLYLGISILSKVDLNGFGWYCLFVAITCLPNSSLAFSANDIRFGVMWLVYAFLWFLFWLLTSLKKQIGTFTAWITIIVGVVFVWIPGYLMLVGKW